ncbi:GNAT family N-acetyltransferase [Clostridium amazonitimonense]|uniref:GNAT family N-acetyltransferase n=1 Tax=Clostridium amazonitimonense TaxID=1499689 RepID=UPI0005093F40|nr:GNAT family N-acetyltransferase [Clostridium amazonitimonense]
MVKIIKLLDNEKKSKITNLILRALPEWFGIEEAIVEYTNGVKNSDLYVAYLVDTPVGFISIKHNNIYTSEIYVMAILKEYQGNGIGRKLLETAQEELIKNKVKFLMVKTLGDSHPDNNYKRTRGFYNAIGFYPLEEIKEIWGEENPCLIMLKAM